MIFYTSAKKGGLLGTFVEKPVRALNIFLSDDKYVTFKLTDGQLDIETNAELTEAATEFKEKMIEILERDRDYDK